MSADPVLDAAARLLAYERTLPHGDRLPVRLDDMPAEARASLVFDGRLAISAAREEDAAYALARARGVEWLPDRRPFWIRRVRIARGVESVREVPEFDEEARQREIEANMRPQTGNQNVCRRCGAPMRWAKHFRTQKPMPLDPEPVAGFEDAGNVLLDGNGVAYVFRDREQAMQGRQRDIDAGGLRGITGAPLTSHFMTCPDVIREREAAAKQKAEDELRRVGGEQLGLGL